MPHLRIKGAVEQINEQVDQKAAIPASPLTFLYRLCRKAFSVPFDDPLIALDATSVANNDAIRGFKPFLISV